MKNFCIFLHRSGAEDFIGGRFDMVSMPNGSIAALLTIAHRLGVEATAIDEGWTTDFERVVFEQIENALSHDFRPWVLATVLNYNAESTLFLLSKIKAHYGEKVNTGVGGHLVRCAPRAYQANPIIDCVSVGDGEVTLDQMLAGKKLAVGSIYGELRRKSEWGHYAPLSYNGYLGISERLDTMEKDFHHGPFAGIRQLIAESVRGCSWAYTTGRACDFCGLQDVLSKPVANLAQIFEQERQLVEQFGANWLFDVSSQWLPTLSGKEAWLTSYLTERQKFGVPKISRYCYLTSNSITESTASLLKEAGIRIAYVGLDGWNRETLSAHHKALPIEKCLKACKANGIFIRTAAVVGEGATPKGLEELRSFVCSMVERYDDILIEFGCFTEVILPGSPIWARFEKQASKNGWQDISNLYEKFYRTGFLSREEENKLSALCMEYSPSCSISFEEAQETERWVEQYVSENSTLAVGTTPDRRGNIR